MSVSELTYLAVLTIAALLSAGFAFYVWRHREAPGARYVVLFMLAATVWSGGELGLVLATSFKASVVWQALLWVGVVIEVPAWFLFVLIYTGRGELITRRTSVLIWAIPILTIATVATNNVHELVFVNRQPAANLVGLTYSFGPLLWLHSIYAYLLLGVGGVLLLVHYQDRARYYRRQVVLILVGALAPTLASLLYVGGVTGLDFTPLGFIVSGITLSVAISRMGLMDVVPVARDVVVDTLDAGVFVIDSEDRLLDSNPHGRELLDVDQDESIVGRSISAFPVVSDHYFTLIEENDTDSEIELEVNDRVYRVRTSPLFDHRDRLLARVILVYDISEQKRRERELARRNEQLDRFASMVSHDLRNPLSVARASEQMLREDDDEEYLDRLRRSHERIEAIIEDVLTVARSGETVTNPETVSIASVAEDAWRTVETADATLHTESDRTVQADSTRLRQLLENLFRNAIEHGGDDVTVTIGSFDRGFFVGDDGPGISDEDHEKVFESGYSTADDGTGFGLDIVQTIADAHGWTVSAVSSESGGTRFEFTGA